MNTKVVYGISCTWWDLIDNVTYNEGIPTCPNCGGLLYELPDLENWFLEVARYAKEIQWPGYNDFVEWLQGRCYPDLDVAKVGYEIFNESKELN